MPEPPSRLVIDVAIPSHPLYRELGEMVEEVLTQQGHCARLLLYPAAPRGTDLLLLVGDPRKLEAFAEARGRRGLRPRTALWQLEPLPPPDLSPEAERIGLRVAGCHTAALPRLVRWGPLGGTLVRWSRSVAAIGFNRAMASGSARLAWPVSSKVVYFVMSQYASLRRCWHRGVLDAVFVTTPARREFLARRGIPSVLTPVGHHARWGADQAAARDIDVLMLGQTRRSRRRAMVGQLARQLGHQGFTVRRVEHDCFGSSRSALLNRTRILLNLASLPWELPGLRMLLGASCGALVVNAPAGQTAPYRPGVHCVAAPADELPQIVLHYLRNERERRAIAAEANRFVREELTLSSCVEQIVGSAMSAERKRAA